MAGEIDKEIMLVMMELVKMDKNNQIEEEIEIITKEKMNKKMINNRLVEDNIIIEEMEIKMIIIKKIMDLVEEIEEIIIIMVNNFNVIMNMAEVI